MYVDSQTQFSNAQAITASAESENVMDLRPGAESRIGTGENLYIHINVDVAFADAGSDSTVTVTLESDDAEAFPSATTRQTIGTFGALSAIGARLIAKIAPEILTEAFVRLQYTVANGNLSTGSVTAFVTTGIDAFTAYPSGFTIS